MLEVNKTQNFTVRVSDPDPDWIRIQSGQWIRIQEGKNDPDPYWPPASTSGSGSGKNEYGSETLLYTDL